MRHPSSRRRDARGAATLVPAERRRFERIRRLLARLGVAILSTWGRAPHTLAVRESRAPARVAADAVPQSEAIIDSREPVHFVLELNGGTAMKLGIGPGDRVESATIAAAAAKP